MRIAIITHGTPHPSKGGSGHRITVYAEYLAQNHDVFIIRVQGRFPIVENDVEKDIAVEKRWKSLGILFIDVLWSEIVLHHSKHKSMGSRIASLLVNIIQRIPIIRAVYFRVNKWSRKIPLLRMNLYKKPSTFEDCDRFTQLPDILKTNQIDIVIAYGPICTMYAAPVDETCKISISNEGPHLNRMIRYRNWLFDNGPSTFERWITGIENQILCWQEEKLEIALLKTYSRVLFGGQHYLRWAMRNNIRGSSFIPLPVSSEQNTFDNAPALASSSNIYIILMIGHLYQTSNRTQLPILEEVIHTLQQLFGSSDAWGIRVVGNHDRMAERYSAIKRHPNLEFVGSVSDSSREFASANALLVPVTAKTGPRTKIIQAFSHGLPVVAHINNRLGIAELVHYGNCMLGETGRDLAVALKKLHDNPELARKIGFAGRKTYEANYSGDYCCGILHEFLKETWMIRGDLSEDEWWEK